MKPEDLLNIIQTSEGQSIRFRTGDKVDHLLVKDCIGKVSFRGGTSYNPVYNCVCDCGRAQIRRQSYLESSVKKIKSCETCAKERFVISKRQPMKQVESVMSEYEDRQYGREIVVQKIMNEIWGTPPWK